MNPRNELTPEQRESLLEHLSNGNVLTHWVHKDGNPGRTNVYANINRDPELKAAFDTARDIGADAIAEKAMEIIDEVPRIVGEDGRYDAAHVSWMKNRAELRLKLLSKWCWKRYGDRITNEISGPNGGPVQVEGVTVKLVRPDAG